VTLPITVDVTAARAALYRKSFAHFVRASWHVLEPAAKLQWNWHLDAICNHVQAALEGWIAAQATGATPELQNLLINVPPGTAKSRVISVCANAWMWLRIPSWRVLCISANPRVAMRDAVYCRDLILSEWYQNTFKPDWELAEDQNAKGHFRTTEGGFRLSIGVGARITGDRADALIVDDPHDADEVESDVKRQGVLDWWDQAASNRVNDLRNSLRIGVMQRFKENDWSGHVLDQGDWEHLCIPQEFEPGKAKLKLVEFKAGPDKEPVKKLKWVDEPTVIGWKDPRKAKGELMFPARFTPAVLAKERRRLRAGYAGQHQQDPMASEGVKFKRKWFRYFADAGSHWVLNLPNGSTRRVLKSLCWRFGSCDTAMSEKTDADYTVLGEHAVTPEGDLLVFNVTRDQMEDPEAERTIRNVLIKKTVSFVAVEKKANGTAIVQRMVREGWAVRGVEAEGDKVSRSSTARIDMENGKIYFLQDAPWLLDLEKELLLFPNGAHDDQVDMLSYAAIQKSSEIMVDMPSGPMGAYAG
jgi:predicted phage terminase large subunit-like protein